MRILAVGLGNPGPEYDGTRHSIGREAARALAAAAGATEFRKSGDAEVAKGDASGNVLEIALLDCYMNVSGGPVERLLGGGGPELASRLILLHDEIDLPLGEIRISIDRGDGGHNGVKSVAAALRSNAFARVRIGISPRGEDGKIAKVPRERVDGFVLGRFAPDERELAGKAIEAAAKAALDMAARGVAAAANSWNGEAGK
jgi:PTH1 family peptidyl-tRNA hydrolase